MLNEPGLVITDFVDRVGDPDGIVAADGTTHRSETLVADALRALSYAATDGRPLPDAVAVTHPAHWGPAAVEAVRVALSRVSEWSDGRLTLLPDSVAALIALQANPGIPHRGIVAVCDFGGTGTTLALVDAANGYQEVGPAVRHGEFSGDLIDQALLTHVVSRSVVGRFIRHGGDLGDRLAGWIAERLPTRQRTTLVDHRDHADRRCAGISWRHPGHPGRT